MLPAVDMQLRVHPLERVRTEAGLSREILGVRAGIASRTIFGIEREGRKPNHGTLVVLAQVLGVEPDELREDPPA
jgi:transcriptional regulator with XRE-family HTH domain